MKATNARRSASYTKYLSVASEGSVSFVNEVTGILVDLQSPAEQELKEVTEIDLGNDQTVEVPTGWKAIVVNEDGVQMAWRWPGHLVDDKSELGVNIITKGKTLGDVFESTCHFWRDDSRRAHVDIVE